MYRGGTGVLRYESTWADGADVPGVPSWVPVSRAIDVAFNGDKSDADASSRMSKFRLDVGGLLNGEITFGYRQKKNDANDAVFLKLYTSWLNGTPILIQYLSGVATGDDGWQMAVSVTGYSESQPNDSGASAQFTLKPFPAVDASGNFIAPARVSIA